MKRVLVTGANGFIGRHVLMPLAERGFEVHAVAGKGEQVSAPARWYRADLLDSAAARALLETVKPSHLLHFAWYALPRDYRESAENLRWCRGGIALLEAFAQAGGERAVFAGSCFEYDPRWGFCQEDLTPNLPSTFYATCKNALRQVALGFSRQAGLSIAWGRIFYLYGPHEAPQRLVPSVILSLLRGARARCTHGRQLRDFLYVADVADAFAGLLDSAVEGTVNIGSGEPIAIRTLVSRCAQLLGRQEAVDFGVIEPAPSDPPAVIADVRKLRDQVGWRANWPLDRGVEATIEWWRRRERE